MSPLLPAPLPAVLGGLLATVLLAGCGNESGADAGATSTSTPATASEAAGTATTANGGNADSGSTAVPSFPGDTEPDTSESYDQARVTVSDIRIGAHDGFDRVVLEVGGEGTPGWDVRYVEEASSQGSGDVVEVAGDAVLQVTVTGAGYPYDTGVAEFPVGPLVARGTAVVTEVVFDSTYEGTSLAFVGTQGRAPFRVYLLEGPTRVVLEVAHAG